MIRFRARESWSLTLRFGEQTTAGMTLLVTAKAGRETAEEAGIDE